MSKVRRAGSRNAGRRKTKPQSAAVSAPRRLRNWAEAQIRGVRYRMANAARFGGLAVAGLSAVTLGGLALFGQLDDVTAWAGDRVEGQLADAGFAVRAVDVTGARGEMAHEIVLASQITDGQSIFSVDPEIIRSRVEAMPIIRRARVARLLPNRIAIVVETREAFALWQVEGGLHVIDRDGIVLADADVMNPPDLPLVVAEGANQAAPEIVDALSHYPDVAGRVVGAVRVGERRWNLRLDSGADVKLPEGDVVASIAILARLQAERGVLRLAAESFDLRGEGDLIVRALPDRAAAAGMREREA
ncbi:cell division protein FtsQ/DivIB [Maricaulis sp.]|uniref:cell division protein FtsQ/DivIB n=1 Tax=Maricaulis sp. TaxID=1486257 RepID=UPI0025D751A3|nr:cell division protein FtsQ/DivIB [Maricaulis sp.]MDF1768247.1 cell division protein FtsQ/DivIB [Maricaulis sp.]